MADADGFSGSESGIGIQGRPRVQDHCFSATTAVSLNFSSAKNIATLRINGLQGSGTWGSLTSTAANKTASTLDLVYRKNSAA